MHKRIIYLFIISLLFSSCAKRVSPKWTKENSMQQVSAISIEDDLSPSSLTAAVEKSLSYYQKIKANRTFVFNNRIVSRNEIIDSHKLFLSGLEKYGLTQEFNNFLEDNFDFYSSTSDKILITGYFEASLRGSKKRSERYHYPLYKKPDDLVTIQLNEFFPENEELPKVLRGRLDGDMVHTYYDREEIDYQQNLSGKSLEIVWVDDILDAFFLHIQGSGIVELDDGGILRVNYASQNGHPYKAIGKYLVKNGYLKLKDASMQGIIKVLTENPEIVKKVLIWNPSYVFFREVSKGPIGSIGQVLTPFRSIALDKSIFPRGALAILKSAEPVI